ncbi:exodeoxyribonuclease VII large subunit [uncultured Enterococcus sp.]|uniref:exodeoxyribonuclease VII large subunit n=1 Tax=uncultured Enterococcus sp. TaxID=167972 RepID=UPI0025CE831A|nr:exodeoxyribonuclease VII large subunit [uncultured Enterococcus sp.]
MKTNYLSIAAITAYLKRKFDADPYLERVYLTGEISNFRLRPNHQYFSLKDDQAKLSAVMFKQAFAKLNFEPKEGMKVLVVGRISLFETTGNYQLYVEHMEPDGVGALYQAFEQLKEKLAAEGLFNRQKRALPKFPKRIAVLTSPSGAVIRDIMTTVQRRYPIAQIVLFPTVVQGERSAANIVENLERVKQLGDFDTVIVGRGGGSIEDLWPFNEEQVARAIVSMPISVISSVGHETDTTIADLVADVRAATPTAAAELAVPVLTQEVLAIKEKQLRLEQAFLHQIDLKKQRYQALANSYILRQPERLYESKIQKVDVMIQRLQHVISTRFAKENERVAAATYRLSPQQMKNQVTQKQQEQAYTTTRLMQAMTRVLMQKQQQANQTIQALDLLSPLKIMSRGYSYATSDTEIIRSVEQLNTNDHLTLHLADGQAKVDVRDVKKGQVDDPTDI